MVSTTLQAVSCHCPRSLAGHTAKWLEAPGHQPRSIQKHRLPGTMPSGLTNFVSVSVSSMGSGHRGRQQALDLPGSGQGKSCILQPPPSWSSPTTGNCCQGKGSRAQAGGPPQRLAGRRCSRSTGCRCRRSGPRGRTAHSLSSWKAGGSHRHPGPLHMERTQAAQHGPTERTPARGLPQPGRSLETGMNGAQKGLEGPHTSPPGSGHRPHGPTMPCTGRAGWGSRGRHGA